MAPFKLLVGVVETDKKYCEFVSGARCCSFDIKVESVEANWRFVVFEGIGANEKPFYSEFAVETRVEAVEPRAINVFYVGKDSQCWASHAM